MARNAGTITQAVVARGLVKDYHRGSETVHALRGVDVTVAAGELVAMAGPSGSGKSTLLAVLAGWEVPDAGELSIATVSAGAPPWSRVGIVPQALGLLEELSLGENVGLPARLAGVRGYHDDVERLLDALDMAHVARRLPREASMGEQQRAAVARALLLRPTLVLADEPTSHQDHARGQRILGVLRDAAARGSAVIVASHDQDTLDASDRILHLRDGHLVEHLGANPDGTGVGAAGPV